MMTSVMRVAIRRCWTGLLLAAAALLASMPASGMATGGDAVFEIEGSPYPYRVHVFTNVLRATFNDGENALHHDTNVVDTRTIQAGDVVYVEDSLDPDQVGKTFRAAGSENEWIWTFYGLEVTHAGSYEVFMAAGGGQGGSTRTHAAGAGGGAGGYWKYVEGESQNNIGSKPSLWAGYHPVRIGRGGTTHSSWRGESGSDTVFATLTAKGGGGGGGANGTASTAGRGGWPGGSGGGEAFPGGSDPQGPGSAEAGQGHDGGSGVHVSTTTPEDVRRSAGGGGGGAGQAGFNGVDDTDELVIRGGDGGDGIATFITGEEAWFCGGGGGAARKVPASYTHIRGLGGKGGGGNARVTTSQGAGLAGTANTGGGGGGSMNTGSGSTFDGGNGGSGIVIVRYALPPPGWLFLLR